MKKIILLIAIIVCSYTIYAQAPHAFKYQAAVRDAGGNVIADKNINFKITLVKDSINGSSIYSELQNIKTNLLGIVNFEIGNGQFHSDDFSAIQWGKNKYFVKVELDADGNGYKEMGTQQLLSVPYALFAEKAGDSFSGNYLDLTNKPTLFSGSFTDITNKPTTIAGYSITDAFDGTWSSLSGKPSFASVATSGDYTDLTNKPTLFSGSFTDLTNKPTTLAGYGITNAMNTSHPANGITATNITNWNTAYGWGNHATQGYLKTETDPVFNTSVAKKITAADTNKWNAKSDFSGSYSDLTSKPTLSTVATTGKFSDLTNKPTTVDGYGITDVPRIIAGTSAGGAAPTIAAGSGFTITKGSTGWYKITFDTPFTSLPSVTIGEYNSLGYAVSFAQLSKDSFVIWTATYSGGGYTMLDNAGFSFIAIGK